MKEFVISRDMQRELVKALGLPLDGCVSVEIEMPSDCFAAALVRYHLPADALAVVAQALKKGSEP